MESICIKADIHMISTGELSATTQNNCTQGNYRETLDVQFDIVD